MTMTFDEWLELGVLLKFCSEPECQTHNMIAMTPDEHAEFEEGGDPCIPVVRLWLDGEAPGGGTELRLIEGLTTTPGDSPTRE